MTRTLSLTLSVILLLSLLAVPTVVGVEAQTTPTMTTALTTTTTTWVLTGPDGINPDYTSTQPWTTTTDWLCDSTTRPWTTTTDWVCDTTFPPTTTTTDWICDTMPPTTMTTAPPAPMDGEVDLLTEADVELGGENISVLAYPTEGFGMCADCYTYEETDLYVFPTNAGPWDAATARYLHLTVRTNMPFSISINSRYDTMAWFTADEGTEDILPAGGYRFVIDLYEHLNRPASYILEMLTFTLYAPGSISVGHIALSNDDVCLEPIPNIQTTTKPSFPWDTTTMPTTTDTTWPTTDTTLPTTTTTLILTGPGGINPDYTSTQPWTTTTTEWGCISTPPPTVTTTAPPVIGELDLLSASEVGVGSGNIAVLSHPMQGNGMCADCYGNGSNDGDDLYVYPLNGGPWDASTARYLHMTVRTNMPFAIRVNSEYSSAAWFAKTVGTAEILPAGGYRFVIDLYEHMGRLSSYRINSFGFTLHAAGSISIGHISLSNNPVCDEPIPNIQTTTKPSFPWDTTTMPTTTTTTNSPCRDFVDPDGFCDICGKPMPGVTTTTTAIIYTTTMPTEPPYTSGQPISTRPSTVVTTVSTTPPTTFNPTEGDALLPGDVNGDSRIDMRDAYAVYRIASGEDNLLDIDAMLADMNGDGVIDMRDAFMIYRIASGE